MFNKKILITGGAGFIGYHLTKCLIDKKYTIKVIDKNPFYFYKKKFKNLKKNENFINTQID